MSERTAPVDIKKLAKRTGAVIGALMAAGALNACTPQEAPRTTPTVDVSPTLTSSPAATAEASPQGAPEMRKTEWELKQEYIASAERTRVLNEALDGFAERIQKASESGKIGVFTTYNPNNGKWQKRDKDTSEGWVWLQHSPQDAGIETKLSVTAYRGTDGEIDWDKGVKSLRIGTQYMKHVAISSPEEGVVTGMLQEPGTGYEMEFYDLNQQPMQNNTTGSAETKQAVEDLDNFTLDFADAALKAEGI